MNTVIEPDAALVVMRALWSTTPAANCECWTQRIAERLGLALGDLVAGRILTVVDIVQRVARPAARFGQA